MALFYVGFRELNPLLVDASDADHAVAMAKETAGGEQPSRVTAIPPGVFAGELFVEDDADPDQELPIVLLDHVVDLLEQIDAADTLTPAAEPARCGRTADADDGEVVTCELARGHEGGMHEGLTSGGELVTWSAP